MPPVAIAAALALATAASLALRTGTLDTGYWIDEAISVGIASRDLADIPQALRQDGSPPLYYLLLHEWMGLVGTGEAATRSLSLIFAGLAVPVSWWAGAAIFDRRVGTLAAALAAGCPFLTYYAQETRMYSLVGLLSVLATASFLLAFVHGRRRHLPLLGAVDRAAALHPYLGRVPGRRDGARVARAVAGRSRGRPRRRVAGRGGGARVRAVAAERRPPGRQHRSPVGRAAVAAVAARRPRQPVRLARHPGAGAGRRRRDAARMGPRPPVRVLLALGAGRWGSRGWPRSSTPPGRRATSRCCSGRCCSRSPRRWRAARAGRWRRWPWWRRSGSCTGRPPSRATRARSPPASRPRSGPRGRRRLHPARAGAGALPLPAAGRHLPHAAGDRARPRDDRLARRPSAGCAAARPSGGCCPWSTAWRRGAGSCS